MAERVGIYLSAMDLEKTMNTPNDAKEPDVFDLTAKEIFSVRGAAEKVHLSADELARFMRSAAALETDALRLDARHSREMCEKHKTERDALSDEMAMIAKAVGREGDWHELHKDVEQIKQRADKHQDI